MSDKKHYGGCHKVVALLLAASVVLPGCAGGPVPDPSASGTPTNGAEAQPPEGCTVVQVPVFREKLTDERATLRFYDDMPSIAYMNVADYYKLLLPQGTMDMAMQDDGTWLLTSHTGADEKTAMEFGMGGTATVDPAAGTVFSANLPAFTNVMSLVQDGMDNVYLDNVGVVRVSKVEYDKPAQPVTIDLAKYGIVVRADDDGVWLPVHTLTTFFTNCHYDHLLFNGKKLYVVDEIDNMSLEELDPEFGDPFFESAERPDDMIAFDYAQFCLVFDYFYGKPATAPEVLKTQGLDAYLSSLGDDGKAVKDALMSKDYALYLHGCDGLNGLLNVDGHTTIDLAASSCLEKSTTHADLYQRYLALKKDEEDPINKLVARHKETILPEDAVRLSCKALSRQAFGSSTYVKRGDTAVIALDSFDDIDMHGWKDYLEGKGPRPSGVEPIGDESSASKGAVDTLGIFLDGLQKAEADPEVKNVVIDVTKNDGGSDDVVIFITSIIANREHERFENILTGQTVTEHFDVDRNLDGAFDDKDAQVSYPDLRFAVLTSTYSFSCANQFPCLLKEEGVPIIGEPSGGGSCTVVRQVTGAGPTYSHSSWLARLVNNAGEDIDVGVPVDVDLLERAGSKKEKRTVDFEGQRLEAEIHDYSSFFDLENLSQVMNELYGTARTT
jgi:hypothetical protein